MPGEDARFVFPNATRTNLVMTTNLRALIHMSGLRLCTMAQWEIRRLFQLIRHEIFGVSPFLGSFLAPKCVPLGYCDEFNNRDEHCPIRPHKDNVLAAWAQKRDEAKAKPAGSCRSRDGAGRRPVTIRLELNRIAPGVEIGPHRHGVETLVYLAGGELVFEHGEGMSRRLEVGPGRRPVRGPGGAPPGPQRGPAGRAGAARGGRARGRGASLRGAPALARGRRARAARRPRPGASRRTGSGDRSSWSPATSAP